MSASENDEGNLEKYRDYLALLARLQLERPLHGKIDVSGIIQQTMMEAYQARKSTSIKDADHEAAWLRRILTNNLSDEIRKIKAEKRDWRKERSLEAALEKSSARLQNWLSDGQPSPSGQIQRQEDASSMSTELAKLPEAQREALILRYFQGCSLAQIAEQLQRSETAVAGLLKRGLQHLRRRFSKEE